MKERPILFSGAMVRAVLANTKTQTRRVVKGVEECPHGYDGVVRATVPQEAHLVGKHCFALASGESLYLRCPYGEPGDRLWVRENGWQRPERTPKMMREGADTWEPYYFDADGLTEADHEQFKEWGFKRRPSIHMPRRFCRLELEVTGVRVERVQEISEVDAKAEGLLAAEGGGLGPGPGFKWHGTGYHGAGFDLHGQHTFHTPAPSGRCSCVAMGSSPAQCAYRELWGSLNAKRGYGWDVNPWVWCVSFRRIEEARKAA